MQGVDRQTLGCSKRDNQWCGATYNEYELHEEADEPDQNETKSCD
jgi:hypothetical protein